MGWFWGKVLTTAFGIPKREVRFSRRGFSACSPQGRRALEAVGEAFLAGYHAALTATGPDGLVDRLGSVERESRGFAYEGAGMALSLLDRLLPGRRNRFAGFLAGPGEPYAYLVYVGAGWSAARLGWVGPSWAALDPLLRWLVLDGYGFHHGYFYWRRFVSSAGGCGFGGYARRAFDQGLGRSLWFVCGADPGAVAAAVVRFDRSRRPDLWSGVGLAGAYAGGASPDAVRDLAAAAGECHPHVAQGVAFAAKARAQAGNPAAHTETACRIVCGLTADQAARLTDEARSGLPGDGREPAYECWRARIRESFATHALGARGSGTLKTA